MIKLKGIVISLIAVAFAAVIFIGCGGVSDEEMAQLESLRKEVNTLNSDINGLRTEKTTLEREIAEKNSDLAQCVKDKEETQKNLENLPK
jgi:septal ring factor EnvC (AmiA/AmiB activator)